MIFRLIKMFFTLIMLSWLWIEDQIYFVLVNFKYTLHNFQIVSVLFNKFLKCVSVKMKHYTMILLFPFPDPPQPLQIIISLSTFVNSTFLYSHISKTMHSCLSVPRLFHVRLYHLVHPHCQNRQCFLHFRLKNILFCKSTTLSLSIPCFKNTNVNFLTWLL
jgi:hypothetical protein